MPAVNPYTGDTPVSIGGRRLTLAFDWLAISAVRTDLGADGQAAALAGDLYKLASLIAIGLRRHHPDWTGDMVVAASPPVVPTIKAVEAALAAAWFGPDGMPKEPAKENPPEPLRTRCARLWQRLTGRG
ncbi:hypothetical protein [Magnetospirillum aberrantis]|uniref:Uncharacterized protein n=1 Tax=Magnetospirillum aberrantis SpK TaxID=908842 RepID=A0A7C9UYL8_9PROT|nr:hypothetical protein [Magnetospirillum aberrantis]NFV79995.1 hypothetical protein [Magnetospirillum aberrantis SpK]